MGFPFIAHDTDTVVAVKLICRRFTAVFAKLTITADSAAIIAHAAFGTDINAVRTVLTAFGAKLFGTVDAIIALHTHCLSTVLALSAIGTGVHSAIFALAAIFT